jgi:cytochrome P450/NADPH-cytochrome P450 reductase
MTTPIPQPPTLPIIGNLRQIDTEDPILSLINLAKQYGEIYQLSILGLLYRLLP